MKRKVFALLLILVLLCPAALGEKMLVHIDAICPDANHVGTKWDGAFYIGGVEITDGSIIDLYANDYELYTEIGEYDATPDIGYATDAIALTANELLNGFTWAQTIVVTENKGMYRDYYTEWYVNFSFIPVTGCYVLP